MSIHTADLRVKSLLLAENLDPEMALQARHFARQYRAEKLGVSDLIKTIQSGSTADKEARLAAAYWAIDKTDDALSHAAKQQSNPVAALIQAYIAEESGKLEDAVKFFQKAGELAPSSAACVLGALSPLRKLGKLEQALALIEKLRREFGDKAALSYHEGRCLEEQGSLQQALDCYNKAIELDGKYAEAIYHAARLCDIRGLDEEAKNLYKRIGPGKESCYINACLSLAQIYDDEGDNYNAVNCCQRVLSCEPNNYRAKIFLKDSQAGTSMYYSPEETKQSERMEAVLRIPVSDFELSVRSRNCLSNMNIQTLGDLVKRSESEMLAYKNFGETSLREIKEILASRNLRLGMMREDAATRAAMERARRNASQEILGKPIIDLDLGVRSRKCVESLGIRTIGELAALSEAELCGAKNFGRVSLNEIKKRLAENGLSLRES
jgi:DNA-directed RNA polymerase subunit alpha